MSGVTIALCHLLAIDGISCDIDIYEVTLLGGLGNVVGDPKVVVARNEFLVAASDGECAILCQCYGLAILLTIRLAPCHLLLGVKEEFAAIGGEVSLYIGDILLIGTHKLTLYALECYLSLQTTYAKGRAYDGLIGVTDTRAYLTLLHYGACQFGQ